MILTLEGLKYLSTYYFITVKNYLNEPEKNSVEIKNYIYITPLEDFLYVQLVMIRRKIMVPKKNWGNLKKNKFQGKSIRSNT